VEFVDGAGQVLTLAGDDAARFDFEQESFSYALWLRSDALPGSIAVLSKGGRTSSEPGYATGIGDVWRTALSDGAIQIAAGYGEAAAYLGAWTMLAAHVDRGDDVLCAIANGYEETCMSIDAAGTIGSDLPLELGASFNGGIDQVRFYEGLIQRGAFPYEHQNLADPDFLVVGPEVVPTAR
jgi:hypothetical protein